MKKIIYLLLFLVFGVSVAFAEVELNLGYGYGSKDGGYFHSQLGWKQIYSVPLIVTLDYDVRLANISFQNLDLNTSLYYKRFTFGVGWGYQWYKGEYDDNWSDDNGHMYIKPNVSLNFKYMKFSLESRIFFDRAPIGIPEDKDPEIAFTVSFRDEAAAIAATAVVVVVMVFAITENDGHFNGDIISTSSIGMGNNDPQIEAKTPSWGDINLEGGAI